MFKSKLLDDERGAIAWLLSQIGLLLAAGVLIGAIAGLTFYSDWEKEAETKNIASHFATTVESVSLREFPGRTKYMFPLKDYTYNVTVSTDYVTVRRGGALTGGNITAHEEMLVHPWPGPPLSGGYGAEGLYNYFGSIYGSDNNGSSRDTPVNVTAVEGEFSHTKTALASHPFAIDIDRPVYVEKMFLYVYENNDPDDVEREEYVIIYQR